MRQEPFFQVAEDLLGGGGRDGGGGGGGVPVFLRHGGNRQGEALVCVEGMMMCVCVCVASVDCGVGRCCGGRKCRQEEAKGHKQGPVDV